jgi:hypothetical protein
VTADATGAFSFSGPLPGSSVKVIAASTLNDPAHPGRVGSSSQFSQPRQVVAGTPSDPLLSALGGVVNLTGPPQGPAHIGDVLRFNVTMTSVGLVDVTAINSTGLSIPPGLSVVTGSGTIQGGAGFIATDSGFSGGTLAPGNSAIYSLDADVTPSAQSGMAVFTLYVNADRVVSIPVVGRMQVVAGPGSELRPMVWLPLVMR